MFGLCLRFEKLALSFVFVLEGSGGMHVFLCDVEYINT